MSKLSPQQQALLQEATCDQGCAAAPEAGRTAASLIKRGLLLSIPGPEGARLMITEAGRHALQAQEPGVPSGAATQAPAPPEPATVKPLNKLDTLVQLLRRPQGATVAAMQAATGWQAHSVRGALAGSLKKGRKLNILSQKTEAGRVYCIPEVAD